ncbi:MAG: hypothetical protein QM532_01510 [Cyanobium sp. MAG06]|nr:hypothetical protein [Cyanobium sp. MAG06]
MQEENEEDKNINPDSDIMEAAFEEEYVVDIEEEIIIVSTDDEIDDSLDIA